MNKTNDHLYRFIAFFPHQDALLPLQNLRRQVTAVGFAGAYSFPICAPIAAVDTAQPLATLRQHAQKLENSGKKPRFCLTAPQPFDFGSLAPDCNGLVALSCPLAITGDPGLSILPLIIGLAPNAAEENFFTEIGMGAQEIFPLRFNAGYVANLQVSVGKPKEAFFIAQWRIGKPLWLSK